MLGLATGTPCQVSSEARLGVTGGDQTSIGCRTVRRWVRPSRGWSLRSGCGADDENRARRVVLDPLGGAAGEDRIADPASSGCHHDQTGVVLLHELDDLRGGRPAADLLVDP